MPMDDWNALARPDDTDADLYQQAIPRVKRRLLMRQRRNGLIIGWAISAVLAILLGVILRNVAITLIVFGVMAFFFLLAFLVDYYHMDEQERRQRWLAAELDKEVELLRRQQTKLKRDKLYRVGDDGELEEVDPAEFALSDYAEEERKQHHV
jgi:hypothetical protein